MHSLIFTPSGRYGATAISNGTDAARGIPSPGPIERYIKTAKTMAKCFPTYLPSLSSPSNFATTATPSTGRITAVIRNPVIAKAVLFPAFCPRNGGKIKFPAPKNNEKSIKLTTSLFFLLNFILYPLFKQKRLASNLFETGLHY